MSENHNSPKHASQKPPSAQNTNPDHLLLQQFIDHYNNRHHGRHPPENPTLDELSSGVRNRYGHTGWQAPQSENWYWPMNTFRFRPTNNPRMEYSANDGIERCHTQKKLSEHLDANVSHNIEASLNMMQGPQEAPLDSPKRTKFCRCGLQTPTVCRSLAWAQSPTPSTFPVETKACLRSVFLVPRSPRIP